MMDFYRGGMTIKLFIGFCFFILVASQISLAQSNYLPIQASEVSRSVDSLYNFLTYTSLIVFIIMMGAILLFVFKYRRQSEDQKTAYITGSHTLEFIWSFVPLVVFLAVFYWGWVVYKSTRYFPEDAITIQVTGFQWAWSMQYANGKKTSNELTVPVGKRVVLNMRSTDVLHSFFVPSFRIKQDVVPGYISKLSFVPIKTGRYHIFCAEYCGTAHSGMTGWVNVVEQYEFEDFLNRDDTEGIPLAELGERTYKNLCIVCHSVDGSQIIGPSFKGIYGRTQTLVDGSTVTSDDNYLRSSILDPNTQIVNGYPPGQMPMFQGLLDEDQITQLIEYMKTLK